MSKTLLSKKEVAARLKVHPNTVDNFVKSGTIRPRRLSSPKNSMHLGRNCPRLRPLMNKDDVIKDGRARAQAFTRPGWVLNDEQAELQQAKEELENLSLCGPLLWSNEVHVLGGDNRAGKTKFCVSMVGALIRGEQTGAQLYVRH